MKLSTRIVFFCSRIKLIIKTELEHFYKYSIKPLIEKIRAEVIEEWEKFVEDIYTGKKPTE